MFSKICVQFPHIFTDLGLPWHLYGLFMIILMFVTMADADNEQSSNRKAFSFSLCAVTFYSILCGETSAGSLSGDLEVLIIQNDT